MNNKKIAQTTIVATIILLLSKVSGFFRDVAQAYAYGTSMESDAFVLALSAVSVFFIIFEAITISFMPIYKEFKGKDSLNRRNDFLNTVYTVIGGLAFVMMVFGIAFAGVIVNVLAPGFTGETYDLTCAITRIIFVSIPIAFFVSLGGQHLRGENSFFAPVALGIPSNIILIVAFIGLSPICGITGVAWASVCGSFVQLTCTVYLLRKKGYFYKPAFNLHSEGLKRIIILTGPVLVGNAIQTINTIIDRMLASGLSEGSMAALNFSNRLAVFVISIISLGAGNVVYTKMSELGASKHYKELISFLGNIINILNIIVVPATVGMMVLSVPIIKTVFEYGAFDSSSSQMTATALFFYAMGLVGYSLRDMITRAFYSLQDSKTPMINGAFAVALNIVLNIILVKFMGIGGLALATSISAIVGTLLLLISLRRKLGQIGGVEMCVTFVKSCIAAGVMGVVCHFGYTWLYSVVGIVPVALMLDVCLGIVVYGCLILCMRIREVQFVVDYGLRKIGGLHRK